MARLENHLSLWLDRPAIGVSGSLPEDSHYDAVVVGAGLTGLTTALMLARDGMSVAVLEARSVGAVATGNTTAKLSLLQGSVLSQMHQHASAEVVRAYVEGNRAGQSWLLGFLAEQDVPVQTRDAFTYAGTPQGTDLVARELMACRDAGLDVERVDALNLPYPTFGAIRLRDQAQFDPMDVLEALVVQLRAHGGQVYEGVRVTGVDTGNPTVLSSTGGSITADTVVLATGAPILDRGLYFAKLIPNRSYAAAFRVPGAPRDIPFGMFLSVDSPTRSLRTAPVGDEELLLIGGNGHPVGRRQPTSQAVADLDSWTKEHFPGAVRTHRWSAQDYQSVNLVPFVGWLPRGRGKIFLASGNNKWGMTNAVAAALSLTATILRTPEPPWAKVLHHRVTRPAGMVSGLKSNAEVAVELGKGWVEAEFSKADVGTGSQAPEGSGIVGQRSGRPTAVSTVDGVTCRVSGICTHLGAVLTWNDAEHTWDCPLHGSRFSSAGKVLEGPATRDLRVLDADADAADTDASESL